ncbi:unnamed protein product [Acanthocheilonema viteae]|uniref:Uncharacterized protein n=1 Tax=Acanthocheilonema viteae TaxID=6277 RepID=A0A498SQT2_ACAVI|nr:unnamed protein product [Acanthocheilonema viteae]
MELYLVPKMSEEGLEPHGSLIKEADKEQSILPIERVSAKRKLQCDVGHKEIPNLKRHMRIRTAREGNSRIERIFYPEFQSHLQYEIHKKQTEGMSDMMSFYLKGELDEGKRHK